MRLSFVITILLSAIAVPSGTAVAGELEYETLARELARLRTEVEEISSQIAETKDDARNQLRAVAAQKTSLDAEIQREELRTKQLQQELEGVQRRAREAGALQRALKPAVLAAVVRIRTSIEGGLPFRVDERLEDLERLERDLSDDVVAPSTAVSRLWTFVEDELRLTRENGLYQQVIDLAGEQVLVDVARVGMLMMYFRTNDERYGHVERDDGGWHYVFYQRADEQRAAALFDSLEKRVRVGFFDLPTALTEELPR